MFELKKSIKKMSDEVLTVLRNSLDDDFFKCMEQCFGCSVPEPIRNILQFNYYNNAFTIRQFDDKAISEIENVMRSDFDVGMVPATEIPDYLCRYSNNQANFKLIGGQRKLIFAMAAYCSKITNPKTVPGIDLPAAVGDVNSQIDIYYEGKSIHLKFRCDRNAQIFSYMR